MRRKEPMKDIVKTETRNAEGYEYKYYLLVSKSARVASFKLPLYSIKIEMKGNGQEFQHELSDIFADVGKAVTFFDEIVEGLVSPSELPFILEDKIMV